MDFGLLGAGWGWGGRGRTVSPGEGGLLAPRHAGLTPASRKPRAEGIQAIRTNLGHGGGEKSARRKQEEADAGGRLRAGHWSLGGRRGARRRGDGGKAGQAQGDVLAVTRLHLRCWERLR